MSATLTNGLVWTATGTGYESGLYALTKTPGRRWLLSFNGEQIGGKAFAKLADAEAFADEHAGPQPDATPATDMDGGTYYPQPTAEDVAAYEQSQSEPETFPLVDVVPDVAEPVETEPVAEIATVDATQPAEEPATIVHGDETTGHATETPPEPESSIVTQPDAIPENRPTVKTKSKFYANWAAAGTPQPFRGETGKLFTIVKILKAAGATGVPVTKEDVLNQMKEAFPEDDPIKMEVTIRNQIPCRLRLVRGLFVWQQKVDGVTRYWIDPKTAGFAEQPDDVPRKITTGKPATNAAPTDQGQTEEPEIPGEPAEVPESF